MNQAQSQSEVRQVKTFLEKQLENLRMELARSEESLKAYKQQARVVALDKETEELVRKVAEFETMYNEAVTDLEANRRRLAYINRQLSDRKLNIDMESNSSQPYLSELRKSMAEKEAELAKYRAQLVELGVDEQQRAATESAGAGAQGQVSSGSHQGGLLRFVDPAQLSGTLFTSKIEVETERADARNSL